MKARKLGATGIDIPAIGLGCMSMSPVYGPTDDAGSIATIHRALDLGINFLDTADIYGAGGNEELVGKAIRGRRNEVIVATKFGNVIKGAWADAEGLCHRRHSGVREARGRDQPPPARHRDDRPLLSAPGRSPDAD